MTETVLDNGVRVLADHVPGARSVAVGVWIRRGTAHEDEALRGGAHLLEHLVFKGTRTRTGRDIALGVEALGGTLDAYTALEHTAYHARVLDTHLAEAFDVLADLVREPLLRAGDLELEREVVLEEIAQVEDTPDDLVFELHAAALWRGHPYGRSILGSAESVAAIDADGLRELHAEAYRPGALLVAAAGRVDHDDLVRLVDTRLGSMDPGGTPGSVPEPGPEEAGSRVVERDTHQAHVVFGARVPGHTDPARYPLGLVSAALGGGMSSRLFQKVREELGLCYSVFSHHHYHARGGTLGVYVGTRPATRERAVEAVREELGRMAAHGLPPDELERVRRQIRGRIVLSLESVGARLHHLTGAALHDEPYLAPDEVLARVDAVTGDDVAAMAARFLDPARQLVTSLGPI